VRQQRFTAEPGGVVGRQPWQAALQTAVRFSVLLDLAVIVGVTILFARPVLNFDESHIPSSGPDWESSTSSMQLDRQSILDHAEYPLWDPYFRTGIPYVAEPKTHMLNPISSVPSLIWGVPNGSKVAAVLSMVAAGLTMYYLAAVVGLSRHWRVWCGLLMAMSGALAGRVFAGHFNLVTGLPYVPLVFALGLQALRRPGVVYPMLAGLASALLFLSGQYYYTIYAVPGLFLTLVILLAAEGWANGRWSPDRGAAVLSRGLAVLGWTVGFSAIELLPQLESRGYFRGPRFDLSGAQTIWASVENFVISDTSYLGTALLGRTWGWWEYYYYVGVVPLVGLALVMAALQRPSQRFAIAWAAALFGLYLAWAAAPHTFFQWIYDAAPFLYRIRVPTRTLALATPFLLLLAAFGFQYLTDWLAARHRWRLSVNLQPVGTALHIVLGPILAAALIAVLFYSLRDVFDSNRSILHGDARICDGTSVAQLLRARDPSVFYLSVNGLGQAVPIEFYELGIKRLDANWEYAYSAPNPTSPSVPQSITVTPKYLMGDPGDRFPGAELIGAVDGQSIYELPQSPYYASTLRSADPPTDASYLWHDKTHEAGARVVSANVIEVTANPPASDDRLLVLESFHPGWRLEIDGKRAGAPENYGGFLSTQALTGEHTYRFVFDPRSFRYGAAVTIGTILGGALLLLWRFASRLRRQGREPPHVV
jgi:hypothetical protein